LQATTSIHKFEKIVNKTLSGDNLIEVQNNLTSLNEVDKNETIYQGIQILASIIKDGSLTREGESVLAVLMARKPSLLGSRI
jgi:hypothetical protein